MKRGRIFELFYLLVALIFMFNGLSSFFRYTEVLNLFHPEKISVALVPSLLKKKKRLSLDKWPLPERVNVAFYYPHLSWDIFLHSFYPTYFHFFPPSEKLSFKWLVADAGHCDFFLKKGYVVIKKAEIEDFPPFFIMEKK